MTEQTQPTDAEIEALGHRMCWRYKHDTGVNHISTFTFNAQTLHDFARAVLAKWGTPAGAGELVACTYGDNGYACCEGGPCQADVHNASITTPQPTQAQAGAVPLTDEWIRSKCKEPWIFEAAKQWVRIAESAHGIKGADHG